MDMFNKLKQFADKVDLDSVMGKNEGSAHQSTTQAASATGGNHAVNYTSPGHGNGKRKALLIGINYFGQKGELKGCINDVNNVKQFIQSQYKFNDIRVLTDDQQSNLPTRSNILDSFRWLVQDAREGDCLFLHYSGHGAHQDDKHGDEADGQDETLVPVDYQKAGMITDDDVHGALVAPLQRGVRLTAVFDCCHSGSIMDLPFT
jgi:uncharacterized caspase-like protein